MLRNLRRCHFDEGVCAHIVVWHLHPHVRYHNALRRDFTIVEALLAQHGDIVVHKDLLALAARQ